IDPLRRRLLLARLLRAAEKVPFEQAIRLADALARFLDEVQTEEADLSGLAGLAPEEFAEHWQKLLRFLDILRESWPAILAERGVMDPAERRRRLLDLQAASWRRRPPAGPLLAAGISGSIPAVARLLATVAEVGGWLVLPGLDRDLDPRNWQAVRADATHPQHGLARLLKRLGIEPEAVRIWPETGADGRKDAARAGLWREVLRPSGTSEQWSRNPRFGADALRGIGLVEAPDLAREAMAIAVRLRERLETPDRTAVLVTTDRNLARRVAAELQRWNVPVEDSAGIPLDQSPPGSFLLLSAHLLAEGAAPATLLAAFKHPLAMAGDAGAFRRRVRALERLLLRGPRPCSDLRELRERVARRAARALEAEGEAAERAWPVPVPPRELLDWLDAILAHAAPFLRLAERETAPLADLLEAHLAFAEFLASDEEGSPEPLWAREAGRRASAFVAELAAAAAEVGELPVAAYPAVLAVLMGAETVRPQRPGHPRIAILGQFESRLLQADLVILGSLNEGHWPRGVDGGPWLNRRMRDALGLPPLEQRIGFAAHDFLLAASAPEVLLTRAAKDETGAPTVPSRWLQRLYAVLGAAGIDPADLADRRSLELATALDRHDGPQRPWPRPAPRPPAAARPTAFWASDIEHLMRDPYRFYARRI
ncbi:MAG TPA: double-strand break repair protein AddB, partial [Rhodospirillales bacterium]|nr:double-strand break repair protein AddB [Rhodospirillales bacterium]